MPNNKEFRELVQKIGKQTIATTANSNYNNNPWLEGGGRI